MSVTFDYFKLELPCSAITITSPDRFSHTISKDGVETHMLYKQKTPFSYSVDVDYTRNVTVLTFTGKSLLENYPLLITSGNISECFDNINRYGVCHIATSSAINEAIVTECDVTADITYTGDFTQLHKTLMLNNGNYTISKKCDNRFYIQTTYVTRRKRECMVIYDKSKEVNAASNRPFFTSVINCNEQKEYFSDKIRLELNLRSVDRIRKYFQSRSNSLPSILCSAADPIAIFLEQALHPDSLVDMLIARAPRLRDLEHLLLLCISGFDLKRVESVVRRTTAKKGSITNNMKPYKSIFERLKYNGTEPNIDLEISNIEGTLHNVLSKMFSPGIVEKNNSLLLLYNSEKKQPDTHELNPYYLLNIPMIKLPYLPD